MGNISNSTQYVQSRALNPQSTAQPLEGNGQQNNTMGCKSMGQVWASGDLDSCSILEMSELAANP